jgi:hypothetical protein
MTRRIRDANGPNDSPTVDNITINQDATVGGTLDVTGAFTATGGITSVAGAGTVTTAATTVAEEYGGGVDHITRLTLTNFSVGVGADNADLAIGAEVYTFPAGDLIIYDSSILGAFTSGWSVKTLADGEYGMGTVIGSTAVDLLSEVGATAEKIMTGQTLTTYLADGTSVVATATPTGDTPSAVGLVMRASAGLAHKLFLNVAATWPNSDASPTGFTFTGVITVRWRKIS